MAMTEKQGGSDVRANTTQARPLGRSGPGAEYRLTGHKWFCSAPMCDAFLTLAQTQEGISCFFVPRWLPDGTRNPLYLQRLKDKLGNRSNASAEVEYSDTCAWLVGEPGRGVPTIIEMVNHTRLDCTVGSAGIIRRAVSEALHHARYRMAFGRRLAEHPLMQNVLADMALESEAATMMGLRVARGFDEVRLDVGRRPFTRLLTAVAKYWVCKVTPMVTAEALECLGGNGYVEESGLPRFHREAPLNSIWEGSGNVICLDVLRTLDKEPESFEALREWLAPHRAGEPRIDRQMKQIEGYLMDPASAPLAARRIVGGLAQVCQAALLRDLSPAPVADAFIASRLGEGSNRVFGTLPPGTDVTSIVERASPPAA
jgi:putative acyl-CoA dehydrogenase